jgi:hypothetical protein
VYSAGGFSRICAKYFCAVGLGPVVACARILVHEVLGRGVQAAVRGGALHAPEVLGRDAQADARGAAQVLGRGAQSVARDAAR